MTRLYLIDDHLIVREGLRALLGSAGMTIVGEADDVTQALPEIVARQPDVVLLDLGLRDVSGLELLRQLAEHALPTRVLVLTMSERPWHVAEAMRLGAAGYVLKGSSGAEVVQAITDVAQGRPHFATPAAAPGGTPGAAASTDPLAALSARERQIMLRVVAGSSSAAIATELGLSPKTVDTYRSRLMSKLGVHDVANLVRVAVRLGVIDSDQG